MWRASPGGPAPPSPAVAVGPVPGLGGLGFQGIGFASAVLGGPTLAADIDDAKLAEAAKCGCKMFNSMKPDPIKAIRKQPFGGTGIAAVVAFVGNEATFN